MYNTLQSSAIILSFLVCAVAIFYSNYIAQFYSILPKISKHLSAEEESLYLNTLQYHSMQSIHRRNKERPLRLAFCCSADLDTSVLASEFFDSFTAHENVNPQHHERIDDLLQLRESFLHYFSKGAAAEQAMSSLEEFKKVVTMADSLKSVKHAVGGNAATMSQRAALEGSHVLLGAAIGEKMRKHFHQRVQFAGHLNNGEHEDIHLVLEYPKGSFLNQVSSPRANRYYLNHDINNAQISALEEFEEALNAFKADVVVIGGLQLMEVDLNEKRRLERLGELSNFLQNLYIQQTPAHFEFASASDFTLFNDIVTKVLPWVNSIGLNEQELYILHHYLLKGEHATTTTSKPTVGEVTQQLSDIIKYSIQSSQSTDTIALKKLDRIHFHTLQFHIICQSPTSKWMDAKDALIQGALISTKLACGNKTLGESIHHIQLNSTDLEVLLPRNIHIGISNLENMEVDPHQPITSWDEGSFKCHILPMLACKAPDHTAGLGDNISGAGMAYHQINHK